MPTPVTVHDVADFTIVKCSEAMCPLNVLKLQKLVYYVQAWHLANHGTPLFAEKFQAWVHGPVSRLLYDRFRDQKALYSAVTLADVRGGFDVRSISPATAVHIQSVLEVYSPFTDSQLEELTHREQPWIEARANYAPNERCDRELSEATMTTYYRARLG